MVAVKLKRLGPRIESPAPDHTELRLDSHAVGKSRRRALLLWVRRVHLWIGLWGAALGLLFGFTGLILNHRSVLKLPIEKTVQRIVQVAIPAGQADSPPQMLLWLQQSLDYQGAQSRTKVEPAHAVSWGRSELRQPERWTINLSRPGRAVNAEYFVGNHFVRLEHIDATAIGLLTRLHMSIGVNAFWVLLADSIAGALILLSLTGVLLWSQLKRQRLLGLAVGTGAFSLAAAYVLSIG